MVSLASLENKISKLVHQRDIIQRRDAAKATKALAQIRSLMSAHNLTVADIGKVPGKRGRPAKNAAAGAAKTVKTTTTAGKTKLPAKYRDPKTGAEWSGWARPPAWIANVKDRTKFLINPNDTHDAPKVGGRKASATTAAKPAVKSASRAASKTAVKKTPGRRGRPPKNAVAAEATTKSLSSTKLPASPKKVTSSAKGAPAKKAAPASRKAAVKTVKAAAAPKTTKSAPKAASKVANKVEAKAPKATKVAKAPAAEKAAVKAVKPAKPATPKVVKVAKAARAPRKVAAPVTPAVAEAPAAVQGAAA